MRLSNFDVGSALKITLINLLVFGLLLGVVEIYVSFRIRTSNTIPNGFLLNAMRSIYWQGRDLIQYNPDCARHDPTLGYTLRPGSCTFSNAEFSNKYYINRMGLRDDANSLEAPEIIVLGDSHAMGWGVEQDQTFAQLIEARLGVPVLNAAISSFGTARERLLLDRLNTNRLAVLIVQYSDNDLSENEAFFKDGNKLKTMTEATYGEAVRLVAGNKNHYFGKHIILILEVLKRKFSERFPATDGHSLERRTESGRDRDNYDTQLFLNAVFDSSVDPKKVLTIVLHLNEHGENESRFIERLGNLLYSEKNLQASSGIEVVPLETILSPQHFYRLDGHLNDQGHMAVAEKIIQTISSRVPTLAAAR